MRGTTTRTVLRASAAGLCAALVLAGCGSSAKTGSTTTAASGSTTATPTVTAAAVPARTPKARYEEAMQLLGTKLQSSLQLAGDVELGAAGTATAGAKDAAALTKAQSALQAAAVKLAMIAAPQALQTDQALLLKGVREYAVELGSIIAQLKAGKTPSVVIRSMLGLKGIKDMETASLQIAKKGYNITG